MKSCQDKIHGSYLINLKTSENLSTPHPLSNHDLTNRRSIYGVKNISSMHHLTKRIMNNFHSHQMIMKLITVFTVVNKIRAFNFETVAMIIKKWSLIIIMVHINLTAIKAHYYRNTQWIYYTYRINSHYINGL